MRHVRPTSALSIGLLALAVILPACRGGLVPAAGCQQLLLPHVLPAAVATIALAPITARTDSEKRVARGVKASPHAKVLQRPVCCHGTAHSQHNTPGIIGQMTGAFGAMMSLALGRSSESYAFR
jgi:hypothetical protein